MIRNRNHPRRQVTFTYTSAQPKVPDTRRVERPRKNGTTENTCAERGI